MELFNNKADFADRPEVLKLLTGLEEAHKAQDDLKSAVLLTRLKQLNITVKAEDKEVL